MSHHYDDSDLDLARHFRPIVYLAQGEQYRPQLVTSYVPKCGMKYVETFRDAQILESVTTTNINTQKYDGKHSSYQAKAPDNTKDETKFYLYLKSAADRSGSPISGLNKVPFYCGVYKRTGSPYYADIVYGFFYAYDDSNASDIKPLAGGAGLFVAHEGDWEHIIVRISRDSNGYYKKGTSKILGVYYQAHGQGDQYSGWYYPPDTGVDSGNTFSWYVATDSEGNTWLSPTVYSSLGSHASYAKAQVYVYDEALGLRPNDVTSQGTTWGTKKDDAVSLMTSTDPWNDFNGKFGDNAGVYGITPAGPRSPQVQGWCQVDSRGGGPTGTTAVLVAPLPEASTEEAVNAGPPPWRAHSPVFKLDFPGEVRWRVEASVAPEVLGRLSFAIGDVKGNVLLKTAHNDSTQGAFGTLPVKVNGIVYVDEQGSWSDNAALERLGIERLILQVCDASGDQGR
jgi:hypothetical protein